MGAERGVGIILGAAMALQVFNTVGVIGPASIADLALFGAAAVVVMWQVLDNDPWIAASARPLGLLMGTLIVWLVIGGEGWHVTQFLGFAAVFVVIVLSVRSTADMEMALWGLFVGAVVASVLTIYAAVFDPDCCGRMVRSRLPRPVNLPRVMGVPGTGSFAAFGTYLVAPLPFALLKWSRRRTPALTAGIACVAVALVILQTRSVYLATTVACSILVVGMFGRRLWRAGFRFAGVSASIFGAVGVAAAAAAWVLYRISPDTVTLRALQYRTAVEVIVLHPFTGVAPPVVRYFPTGNVPHNVVLFIGVVAGIPAIVLFGTLVILAVSGSARAVRDGPVTVGLGVIAGLAGALTAVSLSVGFGRAIWVLIGLGGTLMIYDGRHVAMMDWIRPTVRNSTLVTTLRNAVRGGLLYRVATYDATSLRRKLEAAWRHSAARSLGNRVCRAYGSSVAAEWLLGKDR